MSGLAIQRANSVDLASALDDLTDILHAVVHAGASVGFILPFSKKDARDYWRAKVFPAVRNQTAMLFLACLDGRIVGTIQLGLGLPANQPHRADIAKLLVHPSFRRRGIARALLRMLEQAARDLDKTLLVLDTRSGDSAQPLYAAEGFQVVGEIPGYCRNPFSETYEGTTYMYKTLS